MALEDLQDRPSSRGPLRLAEVKPGRFPEERDAVVVAGETPVIRLKHFAGRPSAGVPPWIEAWIARKDEDFLRELVASLAGLLPPGGRLMVLYGDDETERGLERRFPPAATPLGRALVDAGCTWLKDWYYPEGWLEGQAKLQGNKPLTEEARQAHVAGLREQLEAWLAATGGDDDVLARARARARAVLGE